MRISVAVFVINLVIFVALVAVAGYVLWLVIRALRKYIGSQEVREAKSRTRQSLGEVLRAERAAHKMTQEFVAESLGVSRQAVSKWENGSSDPSTTNLLALAKLYGTSVEALLKDVE
ncbi:MAG: helix-turn-helix transcriptional regulator [Peptococcaceae bacterium]|nr:helix-turn-helix transcriptional regulator [Peptococcaceae bacterium]